jgi:hypothetical protein
MVASYNNMKHSIGKPQPQNHKKNHEKTATYCGEN